MRTVGPRVDGISEASTRDPQGSARALAQPSTDIVMGVTICM